MNKTLPILLHKPVVFFDGVCVLCNGAVRFVVERDRPNTTNNRIDFCRVQSQLGEQLLAKHNITKEQSLDRFCLLDTDGKMHTASSAALRIAMLLPFPYPLLGVFLLIPKFLRDLCYDTVAQNRYKWFGKEDTCRTYRGSHDLLQRFIDREEIDKE
jgi:predicted DCC family thiol-disulfide oxidoreductase YuxK